MNRTNFIKWFNCQIQHCKEVNYTLSKISLLNQTVIKQRLTVFHQLFSWTLGMSDRQNDRFARPSDSLKSSEYHVYQLQKIFPKLINAQIRQCKKFHRPFSKISLYYQTLIDQRLKVFHQLFSSTLKLFHRRNDRFAKSFDSLKSSVSTICIS